MKKLLLFLLIGISVSAFAQHPCTPPVVNISGSAWKCKCLKDTLYAHGPSGTTYQWSSIMGHDSILVTGSICADSTFYVIATNNGCSDTTYFTVVVRVPPTINITPPTTSCGGSNVLLTASASGSGPFTYLWTPGGATTDTLTVNPSSTTTYTVLVSNGCKATKTTTVTPDNPAMSACCDKTILLGDDTMIVASGRSFASYSWSPPGGTCLSASCDSILVKPSVTTNYTVTGTDSLGCQVQRIITIVVEPAAVPTILGTDFVNVYPNPSSTVFTIDIQAKAILEVCDVTGRIIFSQRENAGTVTFGRELTPGMYFLFINGMPAVKLVKL